MHQLIFGESNRFLLWPIFNPQGSGKTYTMGSAAAVSSSSSSSSSSTLTNDVGIIPRAVEQIFQLIEVCASFTQTPKYLRRLNDMFIFVCQCAIHLPEKLFAFSQPAHLKYGPHTLFFLLASHYQSRRHEHVLAAAAARAENLDYGIGTMGRFDDSGNGNADNDDDDDDESSQYACECRVSFLEIHNEEARF